MTGFAIVVQRLEHQRQPRRLRHPRRPVGIDLRPHPAKIAAGAEARALASQAPQRARPVDAQLAGHVSQLIDHCGGERIVFLRPGKRQAGHAICHRRTIEWFRNHAALLKLSREIRGLFKFVRIKPRLKTARFQIRSTASVSTLPLAPGA